MLMTHMGLQALFGCTLSRLSPEHADSVASSKHTLQVATDEEGLQGCWFGASLVEARHNFALVEYQELMDEENTSQHLQEWFPLPDAKQADLAKLGSDHDAHFGPGFKIRPPPPPQVPPSVLNP